jgi:GNAT superfamily N-acetyltransferase
LGSRTPKRSRWCVTSWPPEWRIERATRSAVTRHAESLATLDAELRAEFGDTYSDEPWTAQSFVAERPEKWHLSRLALQGDGVCAFWIASLVGEDAHTHRVGVHPSWRGRGVMRALANEVHEEALRLGVCRMTLHVSLENAVGREAYEHLGYRSCELAGRPAMERLLCG